MATITTTSAAFKAPWQVQLRKVQIPDEPDPNWVRIKVEACGVCGSDLLGIQAVPDWAPFGHEIAGRIEKVGAGAAHLKPGMRVALESASFCGHCERCRNGRVDLCNAAANFWGQPAMGMSQDMLVPAVCCVPYEGLAPEVACLAEPAGVGFDMVKVADIQMGESVCVIGPGPIGLVAAALAKHQAARRVLVIGTHEGRRLETARKLGLETMAADDLAARKELHRQFQHVLCTAPPRIIPAALELLAVEGKLTYVGLGSGDERISLNPDDFHVRKLQLRSSFASPAMYFPAVLALLRNGVIPGPDLISHQLPLAEIEKAMLLHRDHKKDVLKVVVKPN